MAKSEMTRRVKMSTKDTIKLQILLRISELNLLLMGYAEALSDIGCEEIAADVERGQDSLEAALRKLRLKPLSEDKKG